MIVKILKPVRDTVKAWEGEKEPTMHRVIERIYTMHFIVDEFVFIVLPSSLSLETPPRPSSLASLGKRGVKVELAEHARNLGVGTTAGRRRTTVFQIDQKGCV